MRRVSILLISCLLLGTMALYAGDKSGKGSGMAGYIVDEKCAVKGAHAGAEACSKKCIEGGSPAVFVTDTDQKVLHIANQDSVKGHEGQHVVVKGSMEGEALHIDSVAMMK